MTDLQFIMGLCLLGIINILLIADFRGRAENKKLDWLKNYVQRRKSR